MDDSVAGMQSNGGGILNTNDNNGDNNDGKDSDDGNNDGDNDRH